MLPPFEVIVHTPSTPVQGRSRKRWAVLGLGLVLSIVLPVLAFQGIDISESWELIRNCSGYELLVAGYLFLVSLWIRSLRWRNLLAAQRDVRQRSCLSSLCVGFLANNILPFRLGDLVRVGAMKQLEKVSAARGLATVAVERVLDILTLVLILGAYLAFAAAGQHQGELFFAGVLALSGGMFLLAVLVVGYWRRAWVQRLIAAPIGWISPRLGTAVASLIGRFLEVLHSFTSWRQVTQVFGFSLALWGTVVIQYYWVGRSLGLELGPAQYMVVVFATAFGAIIPAAPGEVGTFHGFARLGLYLVAVHSGEAALAFAAVLHLLEWLLINASGLYFVGRDRLTLLGTATAGDSDATPFAAEPGPESAPYAQSA